MCHHPGRSVGRAGVCAVGGRVGWTLELLLWGSPMHSIEGDYLKIVYKKLFISNTAYKQFML